MYRSIKHVQTYQISDPGEGANEGGGSCTGGW